MVAMHSDHHSRYFLRCLCIVQIRDHTNKGILCGDGDGDVVAMHSDHHSRYLYGVAVMFRSATIPIKVLFVEMEVQHVSTQGCGRRVDRGTCVIILVFQSS